MSSGGGSGGRTPASPLLGPNNNSETTSTTNVGLPARQLVRKNKPTLHPAVPVPSQQQQGTAPAPPYYYAKCRQYDSSRRTTPRTTAGPSSAPPLLIGPNDITTLRRPPITRGDDNGGDGFVAAAADDDDDDKDGFGAANNNTPLLGSGSPMSVEATTTETPVNRRGVVAGPNRPLALLELPNSGNSTTKTAVATTHPVALLESFSGGNSTAGTSVMSTDAPGTTAGTSATTTELTEKNSGGGQHRSPGRRRRLVLFSEPSNGGISTPKSGDSRRGGLAGPNGDASSKSGPAAGPKDQTSPSVLGDLGNRSPTYSEIMGAHGGRDNGIDYFPTTSKFIDQYWQSPSPRSRNDFWTDKPTPRNTPDTKYSTSKYGKVEGRYSGVEVLVYEKTKTNTGQDGNPQWVKIPDVGEVRVIRTPNGDFLVQLIRIDEALRGWIDCVENKNETDTWKLVVRPGGLVVYFDKEEKDSVVWRVCSMENENSRHDIRISNPFDGHATKLFELL